MGHHYKEIAFFLKLLSYLTTLTICFCQGQYYQPQLQPPPPVPMVVPLPPPPPPPPAYPQYYPQYPPHYQQRPQYQYRPSYNYSDYEENEYFTYRHRQYVDHKERYLLEWDVDYKAQVILFNITIQNYGWVGLGLSKDGTMHGSDLVIGGIKKGGLPYLMDMHGDYYHKVYHDESQDWTLLHAYEKEGATFLSISRGLETCDPHDYPITEDMVHVLWAYGESDYLEYHFDKRGDFRTYLLDPVVETYDEPRETWRVAKETTLKPKPTSYWCTIHKAPELPTKHHIIGVAPYLPDDLALNHVHHIVLWRCVAPPGFGADTVFAPYVLFPGEECFFNDLHVMPWLLCKMMVSVWAVGGLPYILPYSTGIPFGESPEEYYMLEIHYNNDERQTLTINAGLDIFYTPKLREHDGSMQFVGYDILGLYMIPPISEYFEVYGFCTPDCTNTMLPEDGVEIVAVGLHSHISGSKMKLQHFRNYTELKHVLKDENYNGTFQQLRNLYEPRRVLPGDMLITRCTYDNTRTSNITVVSGFSTREEMCLSIIIINKRIPYFGCFGQVPEKEFLPYIGVEETKWDTESQKRKITKPPKYAGQFLSYVTDEKTDWNKYLRYKMQETFLSSTQIGSCPEVLAPNTAENAIQGTVISPSSDHTEMVELAKAFGETTLMGTVVGLPNRTPGPPSFADYPVHAKRLYQDVSYCPKPYSPFGIN